MALFMENRLEYVGLWLGCTKIGVVPALINFNLRGKSLMHSISAVSASAVIFGSELSSAINDIQPELTVDIRLFSCGKKFNLVGRSENLQSLMSQQSVHPVPEEVTSKLQFSDKLVYIYTSGTTGLPKAAVVKNSRLGKVLLLLLELITRIPTVLHFME